MWIIDSIPRFQVIKVKTKNKGESTHIYHMHDHCKLLYHTKRKTRDLPSPFIIANNGSFPLSCGVYIQLNTPVVAWNFKVRLLLKAD